MYEGAIAFVQLDDGETLANAIHPSINRRLIEVSITGGELG